MEDTNINERNIGPHLEEDVFGEVDVNDDADDDVLTESYDDYDEF